MQIYKIIIGLIIGVAGTLLFIGPRQVEMIPAPPVIKEVKVPVEVEKIVEVEKVKWKTKKCPKIDEDVVCSEYIDEVAKLEDQNEDLILKLNSEYKKPIYQSKNIEPKPNRVNFLVGRGRSGYSMSLNNNTIELHEKTSPSFGLQYERKFFDSYNGNIQIHSNSQISIGFGKDF